MSDVTASDAAAEVVVVVGNPKVGSRTGSAATRVATRSALAAGLPAKPTIVELAPLGPQLFDWGSAEVKTATTTLAAARLAVIATPVYKATYTGLLKSFLDWFGQTGLSGVVVVPVMVGASAAHALAVEVHLRPLLVEIGATVPTRGLFVLEDQLDDLDTTIDSWLTEAGPLLQRNLR